MSTATKVEKEGMLNTTCTCSTDDVLACFPRRLTWLAIQWTLYWSFLWEGQGYSTFEPLLPLLTILKVDERSLLR